jgi:hypothetical protein
MVLQVNMFEKMSWEMEKCSILQTPVIHKCISWIQDTQNPYFLYPDFLYNEFALILCMFQQDMTINNDLRGENVCWNKPINWKVFISDWTYHLEMYILNFRHIEPIIYLSRFLVQWNCFNSRYVSARYDKK